MKIKLLNLHEGVLVVDGPAVQFGLDDAGKASVAIHVSISDGTHFHFPDGGAKGLLQTTQLPPGDYTVVIMVAAFTHDNVFGLTYNSTVTVAGVLVASTVGSLPNDSSGESDFQAFVLRVLK